MTLKKICKKCRQKFEPKRERKKHTREKYCKECRRQSLLKNSQRTAIVMRKYGSRIKRIEGIIR